MSRFEETGAAVCFILLRMGFKSAYAIPMGGEYSHR